MQVFIPAVLVPNSELTLKDPTCKLNNNGTHHKITFAYDECGTLETFYTDYVDIRNEISVHLILNDTDLITFVEDYKIPLQCSLDRSKILNVAIQVESREQITERVEHSADFSLKEYTSADYNEEITEYPIKVPLNREIFFEITLRNNSNSSIGVYVEQCVATPSDNPNDTTHVTLIDVGCSAHTAVKVQPSTEIDRFRFSTQAFRFSGDSRIDNLVYIHCSMSTCGGANCQHSCLPHSRRRRRSARKMTSAILTSGSHVVTS
ncbi:unnamed protein product [Candidula unifasciata]|uniref:ZP domain-containing protein n=1 Tax=Candidula unifasciata TaxID=100452 RepID=A0A8S3YYS9_9EUPU|nr:unnamed protein product [Candidula unifasciata]